MKTCDISGMGGDYEQMCQRILHRGIAYLAEVQPPVEMWGKATALKNVYGILLTEGDDLKALENAIIRPGDDATGAMHQCVMGHLSYIHKHGHDAWLEGLAQHREASDFSEYHWDGQ